MPFRPSIWLLFLTLAAAPTGVRAGNGVHPRTPVIWPDDVPCITMLDRSQGAELSLRYTIPFEDTAVTVDEVLDSRTHQFIAVCRDHSRQEPLPSWLTWKDVETAAARGLVDALDVMDDDVLETSPMWKDCWYPITGPEARRPITFAEAAKPVEWDTTDLPAGAYSVQGYTWEPIFNIFNQRPGVVQIVDEPDLSEYGPAAAVTTRTDVVFAEDPFALEGCFRAMPGATMRGAWALTRSYPLEWRTFAEGVALDGDRFTLPFPIPPEAAGETIALRVDVTDPMQRSYSAHATQLLAVLPGNSGASSGCDDEASFIAEPCATQGLDTAMIPPTSTASTTDDSGVRNETTSNLPMQGDRAACACDARDTQESAVTVLVLLGALTRRRRGSRAQTQEPPPIALSQAPASSSPMSQ